MSASLEVRQRLQELHDARGSLTPDIVLQDARDPESPLHSEFTWDSEEAARKWNLEEARRLIRSVKIEIKTTKYHLTAIGYVRDPDCDRREQGYVSTVSLRSDTEKARRALLSELSRADAALQRAYDVAHSVGLEGEIAALRAQIEGVAQAA